jgi:hypothetical protein
MSDGSPAHDAGVIGAVILGFIELLPFFKSIL